MIYSLTQTRISKISCTEKKSDDHNGSNRIKKLTILKELRYDISMSIENAKIVVKGE